MGRYYYVKSKRGRGVRFYIRLLGFFCIVLGISSFLYLLFPLFSWQFFIRFAFSSSKLESPIPEYLINEPSDLKNLFAASVNSLTRDYTDARNWFENVESGSAQGKVSEYSLSIPKLKIKNALVSTVDYDLSKHLVQYRSPTLPGNSGNVVIFGHSTLPQFFKPTDYKTIFATLHTIKKGDEVTSSLNGVEYRYKVFSITITTPDDTSIFAPSNESIITLVTCTPPGTVWKRLIVKARLQALN